MTNPYYNVLQTIVAQSRARSRIRNDEFNAVEDGFDALSAVVDTGKATFAGDSTGSSNAYAVTMPQTRTSNSDGDEVVFIANHTSTGAATLDVDSIGAATLVAADGAAIAAGDIESGLVYVCRYDASNTRFQLVSPGGALPSHTHVLANITDAGALAALDTVGTTEIDDEAVTLAKLQHIATDTLLGRTTAGTGDVETVTFDQDTWAPVAMDTSFSASEGQSSGGAGKYTQIGNMMIIEGYIDPSDLGTLSGVYAIGNLPAAASSTAGYKFPVHMGVPDGIDSGGVEIYGYIEPGTDYILLVTSDWSGSNPSIVSGSEIDTDSELHFSAVYFV